MPDYQYIDADSKYIDPQSGVLRNLANISDKETLLVVESGAVTKRAKELFEHPIKIKDSGSLFAIHKHLFKDIYEWAGKPRTVEISKGGKQFFPLSNFRTALQYIDNLIVEYRKVNRRNHSQLAHKLAEILDTVNFLHPFREGNGRTQREFLRLLALEKGMILNLNPPDSADVYSRYMQGTITGDVNALTELILEQICVK